MLYLDTTFIKHLTLNDPIKTMIINKFNITFKNIFTKCN